MSLPSQTEALSFSGSPMHPTRRAAIPSLRLDPPTSTSTTSARTGSTQADNGTSACVPSADTLAISPPPPDTTLSTLFQITASPSTPEAFDQISRGRTSEVDSILQHMGYPSSLVKLVVKYEVNNRADLVREMRKEVCRIQKRLGMPLRPFEKEWLRDDPVSESESSQRYPLGIKLRETSQTEIRTPSPRKNVRWADT